MRRSARCRATTTCSPRNFIDDGERLWLIDYEYSGNNDACFELGNIWSEAALPLDQLDASSAPTSARPSPAWSPARGCSGLMAKYGWTLWASIQDGDSDHRLRLLGLGDGEVRRAVAEFDGPTSPI